MWAQNTENIIGRIMLVGHRSYGIGQHTSRVGLPPMAFTGNQDSLAFSWH